MPHATNLMAYGAEVYGPWRVALPVSQQIPRIPPGGLAYSQQGQYLCVFFGQDPAWPVDYIGHVDQGWEALRERSWDTLSVERC